MLTVLPDHFKALIPTGDETLCQQILMLIQTLMLWYRFHKYKFNQDGTFTPEYIEELCAITCPDTTDNTGAL